VSDLTIRPTVKFIMVRTVIAALIFLAIEIAYFTQWRDVEWLKYLPMVAPLVFISPALRALQRQFTSVSVSGDRLRLETGGFSKSSRTIQLSKVQDVRVDQTMTQRMFGVGNISIETAGEASRLTLVDVDNAQAVADQLLDRAHQGGTNLGSAIQGSGQ
jgi:membrane protein YdbS with pleckstrin-like domain